VRLGAALAASRALGAQPHICETELALARVQLAQPEPGDDVVALLHTLQERADALGMTRLAAQARALELDASES